MDDAPLFDSVVVVTDRRVLDTQLQETISGFNHALGSVVTIGKGKAARNVQGQLAGALKPAVARYNKLDDDARYQVRRKVRSFCKWYAYITLERVFGEEARRAYVENTDSFTSLFEDSRKYRAMMNAIGELLVSKFDGK